MSSTSSTRNTRSATAPASASARRNSAPAAASFSACRNHFLLSSRARLKPLSRETDPDRSVSQGQARSRRTVCYVIVLQRKNDWERLFACQSIPWTSVQYLQFMIVACAAFLANFAGGVFARRVADRMHLALGFSAGTVIAVAFFIFMPQAVLCRPAAHGANELLPLVGLGFVIALLLDRFGSFWMADSEERLTTRKHNGHAVLKGAAIGLSYHVSPAVSAVVTAARSEEHTSELQSPDHLVCRLLLE